MRVRPGMPPWARRSAPRRGMQSAVDRCIAVGSLVHGSDDQRKITPSQLSRILGPQRPKSAVVRSDCFGSNGRTSPSRVPGHGRGRSGIRRRAAGAPGAAERQVLPLSRPSRWRIPATAKSRRLLLLMQRCTLAHDRADPSGRVIRDPQTARPSPRLEAN